MVWLASATAGPVSAQISGDIVEIGFITDLSSAYSAPDGPGGAEAIKIAIAEMGGNINGKKIELFIADHQNKTDIASTKAREWDSVIQKMTDEQWNAIIDAHLTAPFKILRAATEFIRFSAKKEAESGQEVFRKVVSRAAQQPPVGARLRSGSSGTQTRSV